MAKYKLVVRDSIDEDFSQIPFPLNDSLKKPKKLRGRRIVFIGRRVRKRFNSKSQARGRRIVFIGRRVRKRFNSKSQAKRTLMANHKQNAGILTPSDLRNTKIVRGC